MKRNTLYVDESGIANLLDNTYNHFLLTGVIVSGDEVDNLDGYFNIIKRKYSLKTEVPFHSFDLFENKSSDFYLTEAKAFEFNKSIAEFIKLMPIQVKVIHSKKLEFRQLEGLKLESDFKGSKENKRKKEFLYMISATKLFYWFASYLEQTNSQGTIIVDSRKGMDQYLLAAYNNSKEQQQRKTAQEKTLASIATRRINSITFSEKTTLTGGLEIVDLISYSFFQSIDKIKRIKSYNKSGIDKIVRSVKSECNSDCVEVLIAKKYSKLFDNKKAN
jgi:phosphoribosyl-AMP cyclohydrolase